MSHNYNLPQHAQTLPLIGWSRGSGTDLTTDGRDPGDGLSRFCGTSLESREIIYDMPL